jgi:signal transduction histidine kinase
LGIILAIWGLNLFTSLRLNLNNIYYINRPTSDKIVIVAIDNASLADYGRSPNQWPRSLHADLVTRLNQSGARVIVFDLLFSESTPEDELLAQSIQAARRNESGNRTRTLLATVGVTAIDESQDQDLRFNASLGISPPLAEAAEAIVYANTFLDVDGEVRRQPSWIQVEEQFYLSLSLGAYLSYLGIPPAAQAQLLSNEGDQLRITPDLTPNRRLYVDGFGLWQQNFFGPGGQTFPTVSFRDILADEADPALFADKIVLVGLINAAGATDRYNVPLGLNGGNMAGVEIQANAIETLLQEQALRRAPLGQQGVLVVLLGLGLSLLAVQLRWYGILLSWLGSLILVGLACFWLFDSRYLIIDLLYPLLAISLPSIGAFGILLTSEVIQRQRTEFLLNSVVEVSEQQLALERILPLIHHDLESSLGAKRGCIYLWSSPKQALEAAYSWGGGTAPPELVAQMATQGQTLTDGPCLGLAFRWQGQLLGAAFLPMNQAALPWRGNDAQIAWADTLAQQIAPTLANARLFAEVQAQQRLLQAIQDMSPNGILILAGDLALNLSNPRASMQIGLELEGRQGQNFLDLLRQAGLEEKSGEKLVESFKASTPFREEIRLAKQAYYIYAIPFDEQGQWLCLLNDVTPLVQLTDLKTQMIRMASHDLKNPLGVIMGYVEFLRDEDLSKEAKHFVGLIDQSAHLMLGLIQDILNLEQLQSGHSPKEPLSLKHALQEAIQHHEQSIQQKGQSLYRDFSPQAMIVKGNHRLLVQAITNLVGNASKYTPEGGRIDLRLHPLGPDRARLEVQDNGYGMPAEAQAKLFSQFYRVRTAQTAHIRGTGLGLSLVKSIIEDHAGQVGVQSVEGQGSTFWIELPLTAEDEDEENETP